MAIGYLVFSFTTAALGLRVWSHPSHNKGANSVFGYGLFFAIAGVGPVLALAMLSWGLAWCCWALIARLVPEKKENRMTALRDAANGATGYYADIVNEVRKVAETDLVDGDEDDMLEDCCLLPRVHLEGSAGIPPGSSGEGEEMKAVVKSTEAKSDIDLRALQGEGALFAARYAAKLIKDSWMGVIKDSGLSLNEEIDVMEFCNLVLTLNNRSHETAGLRMRE
jgi:hypothetical protein